MRARRPMRLLLAGTAVVVGAAGCTSALAGHGSVPVDSVSPSALPSQASSAPSSPAAGSCSSYATPDPNRPRMMLDFRLADDLSTVDGTEQIAFTPDKPITELVFRLTANTEPTVAAGNRIQVLSATADHGAEPFRFTLAAADPSTQGGLLHIPFRGQIPAGTTVTATLSFRLVLGERSFDRFGRVTGPGGMYAWFGSGEPLLAWERGYGWHTEDMLQFPVESATSEAMDVSLRVTAPAADTVLASGDPMTPVASGADRVWTSALDGARDVSVAVGPFQVADATVGGVRLRLGAYDAAVRDQLVPEFERAIRELVARFGPFPFPSLAVARLPAEGGGIEYPGAILMLDGSRVVAVHETAHQYFYAMIGNSQALHPWLDEAFAEYAEELIDGTAQPPGVLQTPGPVDRSTESYGTDENGYFFITYNKGAAALEAARAVAGAGAFDAALRCYVARNAWRIVNPGDVQAALAELPAAVSVLRQAGALP